MDNLPCGAGFRVPLIATSSKRSRSLASSPSHATSSFVKGEEVKKGQSLRQVSAHLTERSIRTHSQELVKTPKTRNLSISNATRLPNHAEVEKSTMVDQVKSQRRAEIYALNAILRQLQQEKIAQYIQQQRLMRETQHACSTEMNLVAAIGV
uniref:AlNc14C62G4505 protein n=1 Tax=Albugo laibachii Nc14 TaxID=890382 RepID=F0WCY0_9STRA|nr:AlNc14C62G4505 [Albugo laibachii Nc14]|eukprot:CCA19051.1 AlNc14C62G4505 [Albugo laibachii Nc14]